MTETTRRSITTEPYRQLYTCLTWTGYQPYRRIPVAERLPNHLDEYKRLRRDIYPLVFGREVPA